MSRESMGGYIPPEETKRKKRETEMELAEIVIESASFSTLGASIDLKKISVSAEIINTGASPAISGNIELAKKTEEYGRIYEAALDKADELVREDKKVGTERKKQREKEKRKRQNKKNKLGFGNFGSHQIKNLYAIKFYH